MGVDSGHVGSGVRTLKAKRAAHRPAWVGDVSHGVRANDSDTTDVHPGTEPLNTWMMGLRVGFSLSQWGFTGKQGQKARMIHEVTD